MAPRKKKSSAKDALTLMDLEAQRIAMDSLFSHAGYEAIEPDILQPADLFLEFSGENIRQRIYVLQDPHGAELCLRPDLTIPTCRAYLETVGRTAKEARYCYDGMAFRCQPSDTTKPNEFPQAGIEVIGAKSGPEADAEVFVLTWAAVAKAGLTQFDVTMGDLGIFQALVAGLDLPEKTRSRLRRSFSRPQDFARLLETLSKQGSAASGLLAALAGLNDTDARAVIADILDMSAAEPVGGRTLEDITERLLEKAFDQGKNALPADVLNLITKYLKISGRPSEALNKIEKLTTKAGIDVNQALDAARARLDMIAGADINVDGLHFATEFGRDLDYYSGFVFEFVVPALKDEAQVAGGGRYDGLLKQLGASKNIPAVGAMIRPDRLLTARGFAAKVQTKKVQTKKGAKK